MRLALVSQEYPPETAKGGIGSQTYAKAHGLAARGHDVVVISRAPDGVPSERSDGRVRIVRIAGFERRVPLHSEIADWITYSAAVEEAIARLHAIGPLDLIDFPEWAAEGYVHFVNRTDWYRTPTVVHLHGPLVMFSHAMGWPEPDSEFCRTGMTLESTCIRLADAVISSSRCSLDWCVRYYGISAESVPIFHTGVDTDVFAPRPVAKESRPTIVFAGKLAANKGIFTLLDAAIALAAEFPDLRLQMLGRGEKQVIAQLRRTAEASGRRELLDLAGFMPRESLPEHFSRAHVFAAPSLYEGGPGFVYLEAMACGLPAIASAGSGAAEVVTDNVTGRLVPPGDVDALVEALRPLLRDTPLRERLGRAARDYVVGHASTPQCIARLEKIYADTVARSGRSQV